MTLAVMLSEDEGLFICDMAETYHVLDYRALPVPLLATLASGLRENSRIKMKIAGVNYLPPEVVIPLGVDYIKMILKALVNDKKKEEYLSNLMHKKEKDFKVYDSGADFMAEWKRLTQGVN